MSFLDSVKVAESIWERLILKKVDTQKFFWSDSILIAFRGYITLHLARILTIWRQYWIMVIYRYIIWQISSWERWDKLRQVHLTFFSKETKVSKQNLFVVLFNSFHATDFFLYFLKTSENFCFSHVFRGFKKLPVA